MCLERCVIINISIYRHVYVHKNIIIYINTNKIIYVKMLYVIYCSTCVIEPRINGVPFAKTDVFVTRNQTFESIAIGSSS